jgi:hypothetical protein
MTCILWGIFYFSSGEQFASSRKDLPVPTRILTLVLIALAALTANPGLGQDLAGSTESTVVALDTCQGLLDELQSRRQELQIATVKADLLSFQNHLPSNLRHTHHLLRKRPLCLPLCRPQTKRCQGLRLSPRER